MARHSLPGNQTGKLKGSTSSARKSTRRGQLAAVQPSDYMPGRRQIGLIVTLSRLTESHRVSRRPHHPVRVKLGELLGNCGNEWTATVADSFPFAQQSTTT